MQGTSTIREPDLHINHFNCSHHCTVSHSSKNIHSLLSPPPAKTPVVIHPLLSPPPAKTFVVIHPLLSPPPAKTLVVIHPLLSPPPAKETIVEIPDTTIVEIPDCFDLTKPLTGYMPWRGVGPEGNISPDCFRTANHNGGSPLHTITSTVWPSSDDVIPVMSLHMRDAESSPSSSQLMHTGLPQASSLNHMVGCKVWLRTPQYTDHAPQATEDTLEHKASRLPVKGPQRGAASSHHLPPQPINLSPPYMDQQEPDASSLLPPPEEWGGGIEGHT